MASSQEAYTEEGSLETAYTDSGQANASYDVYAENGGQESYDSYEEEASYSQASDSSSYDSSYEEEGSSSSASYSSSSGWSWPVSGTTVTSSYGEREAPTEGGSTYHQGIDIAAEEGQDISAAASGTVAETGYNDAMGNYVVIDHGDGVTTTYEHCSDVYAEEGQDISQGDTIAAVGSTGIATGSHLHFGVSVDGESVDPTDYY